MTTRTNSIAARLARPAGYLALSAGLWAAGVRAADTTAGLIAAATVPGAVAGPAASEAPTYFKDVLPIVMGKCASCHNAQSTIYNWMDYKTAYEHRWEIKRRVWDSWQGNYFKQPMPAGNSEECLSMTEADRAMLKNWAEAGGARGALPSGGRFTSETARMEHGKQLFTTICALCHQPTGQGVPEKFPPLAGSDYLNADKDRAIKILIHGRQGEIIVNGKTYFNSMPSFPLSDEDIAAALTYVYNSFGNSGQQVTPEEVNTVRAQKEDLPVPSEHRAVAKAPPENNPYE